MNTVAQTLPTVHAPSLVEHVYKQLRNYIIAGDLVAGTRLLELELATQMHVSQGSTREALGRLERDGLVERKDRRGTFVTEVSHADMREIFALRAFVEQIAVHRIGALIHTWQVHELESVVTAMREANRHRQLLACIEHDHSFHQHVVQWANHATLLWIWRPLSAQIQRFIMTVHASSSWDTDDIAASHMTLIEVLRGGDVDHAGASFEQHILHAWARFEAAHRAIPSITSVSSMVVTGAGP
jgi:DNA-binding GntR family transcriptional regulator